MNILMVDIHCKHPSSNGNILIAEHPKTVFFKKKTGCKLYIHNYKNMEERKLNKAAKGCKLYIHNYKKKDANFTFSEY
jgi:hypothetical protein